jgi:hypothetical protein
LFPPALNDGGQAGRRVRRDYVRYYKKSGSKMGKTILKTSSENWVVNFRAICKSQNSILLINDSSLRNEDLLDIVGKVLKYFTLSSKQLILRKILLAIVPLFGLFLIVVLGYGIFIAIYNFTSLKTVIISIIAFMICLFFTTYTTFKLKTAKKPNINNVNNNIIIEWDKY